MGTRLFLNARRSPHVNMQQLEPGITGDRGVYTGTAEHLPERALLALKEDGRPSRPRHTVRSRFFDGPQQLPISRSTTRNVTTSSLTMVDVVYGVSRSDTRLQHDVPIIRRGWFVIATHVSKPSTRRRRSKGARGVRNRTGFRSAPAGITSRSTPMASDEATVISICRLPGLHPCLACVCSPIIQVSTCGLSRLDSTGS